MKAMKAHIRRPNQQPKTNRKLGRKLNVGIVWKCFCLFFGENERERRRACELYHSTSSGLLTRYRPRRAKARSRQPTTSSSSLSNKKQLKSDSSCSDDQGGTTGYPWRAQVCTCVGLAVSVLSLRFVYS